jgi:hypothetical protein
MYLQDERKRPSLYACQLLPRGPSQKDHPLEIRSRSYGSLVSSPRLVSPGLASSGHHQYREYLG